jgi:hypothetical protein
MTQWARLTCTMMRSSQCNGSRTAGQHSRHHHTSSSRHRCRCRRSRCQATAAVWGRRLCAVLAVALLMVQQHPLGLQTWQQQAVAGGWAEASRP